MNVQFFGNNSENKRAEGPEPCCYFISVDYRFVVVPQESKVGSDSFPDLSNMKITTTKNKNTAL